MGRPTRALSTPYLRPGTCVSIPFRVWDIMGRPTRALSTPYLRPGTPPPVIQDVISHTNIHQVGPLQMSRQTGGGVRSLKYGVLKASALLDHDCLKYRVNAFQNREAPTPAPESLPCGLKQDSPVPPKCRPRTNPWSILRQPKHAAPPHAILQDIIQQQRRAQEGI